MFPELIDVLRDADAEARETETPEQQAEADRICAGLLAATRVGPVDLTVAEAMIRVAA